MASGIGIGELVWVTQGKTDHMAMYIGDIRKPDTDDDDDEEEEEEEDYVSIKWTTTNMIDYVPYSSVRLAMNGQRRRRIVPNHYMAVPAPPARPPANSRGPTPPPPLPSEASGNNKVFLTDKSSSSINKTSGNVNLKKSATVTIKNNKAAAVSAKGKSNKVKSKRNITSASISSDNEIDNDNDDFEQYDDPNIKIGRQYLWEWEKEDDSDSDPNSNKKSILKNTTVDKKKQVPRNYLIYNKNNNKSANNVASAIATDVRLPRSWEEGYGMMMEFYNNIGHCNISINHPILGKFINQIRIEHKKYCKFRSKKKKNPQQYLNKVYRKCSANRQKNLDINRLEFEYNDMTRIDWRRLSKLNNIGFQFKKDDENEEYDEEDDNNNDSFDDGDENENENENDSIHSELLDDDDEEEDGDSQGMLKLDSDESVDYKSGDDSDSDDDTDDDDDDGGGGGGGGDDDDDPNNNNNEESKMGESPSSSKYSFNNKTKRRDLNLILQPPTTNDEFDYDEYLTVSSLDEIDLTDSCNSNKRRNKNGEPTFPIQLCRLLNSSKRLGLDKIISWSSDGNSFHIYSESDFVTYILKKTTTMSKMVSIRNAFGQFNIISPILGNNCRSFQHRSIEEAESSNDPSKRLFYRGVSVDVLRKIKSRREEREDDNNGSGSVGGGSGSGSGLQSNRQPVKKRKHADHHLATSSAVWKDDECDFTFLKDGGAAGGDRKTSSSGRRILAVNRLSIGDGSSGDLDGGGDDNNKKNIKNNNNVVASKSYHHDPKVVNGMSRTTERKLRRTSDGCLHPKGGKEQYLLDDGTYEIPAGKRPANLAWDTIGGLWVPPERVNNNNGDDDSGGDGGGDGGDDGGDDDGDDDGDGDGDGDGGTPSSRGSTDREIERRRRRTKDGCLLPKDGKEKCLKEDGTYRRPDGARPFGLSWHKIRGLWVPSESLRNGLGGVGDDYDDGDTRYKVFNRETERKRRRTSDGCLIPKGGKEKYLQEDGTYRKPDGARPANLAWNKIRGLWVPPEPLKEGVGNDGDDEDETSSSRTTDGSLRSASLKKRKRSDTFDEDNRDDHDDVDGYFAGHDIDEITYDPDKTVHFRNRQFKNRLVERQARRTRDGCLLPKRQPLKMDDGTYEKPKGHAPKNLYWDTIRGLWAPDHCFKKKTDGRSSLSVSSSSSDDEPTIIRASDANLFHHSSPMWRSFFQFKKHNRERRFQARTKGNPTGIIGGPEGIIGGPQLNKSNWGKIEKLMQQQRHHHTININTSTTFSDDGDMHFV